MTENTCGVCKHWEPGVHWNKRVYSHLGTCRKALKFGVASSHDLRAEDIHEEMSAQRDRVLGLEKNPGGCYVATGTDFGCMHWEAREA